MLGSTFRFAALKSPAVLLGLVAAAYGVSLRNGFVFDDATTIVENALLRDWRSWPALFSPEYFRAAGEASYRPIVTLTYYLDSVLWGLNPTGFHLTNLLLHLAAVLLLYYFAATVLRAAQAATWGAALFAAHPMLSEAVNAISFREDLLALVFMLAALCCLPAASRGELRGVLGLLGAWLATILGLLSKEMAATLPLLGLLAILLAGRKTAGNAATQAPSRRRWQTAFVGGALLLTAGYLVLRLGPLRSDIELRQELPAVGPVARLLTAATMGLAALLQMLWPAGMSPDYHAAFATPARLLPWVALMVVLALIAAIFLLWPRQPHLAFGLSWFVVSFAPVSNLVPLNHLKADRYLYVPAAGFCLAAALLAKKAPRALHPPAWRWPRLAPETLLLVFVLACFIAGSVGRSLVWRTDESLWRQAAGAARPSARTLANLGLSLYERGAYDRAHLFFLRALHEEPGAALPLSNLGFTLYRRGVLDRAQLAAARALRLDPSIARAHTIAGVLAERRGRQGRALRHYRRAAALRPGYSRPMLNAGILYFKQRQLHKALASFREGEFRGGDLLVARENIAATFYHLKEPRRALGVYRDLRRLHPYLAPVRQRIQLIERELGEGAAHDRR
ncbi:MAG: hypothetical protein HYY96_07125 [Candidatus Tectomicrobia bacterium]|nr:hypothetical protein [Candidatus Tectomicrobia bacterium]